MSCRSEPQANGAIMQSTMRIGQIIGSKNIVKVYRHVERITQSITTEEVVEAGVADEFISSDDSPWDVSRRTAVMEYVGSHTVVHLPSCEKLDRHPQNYKPDHEREVEESLDDLT